MSKRKADYGKHINQYMDMVYNEEVQTNDKIKRCMEYVEHALSKPGVRVDHQMTETAVKLVEKYFALTLFEWQLFVFALIHAFDKDDSPLFPVIFIQVGRGNGKNGFISMVTWYLTTHYYGIEGYNVDIVANSEEQAKTSFDDILQMLEENWETHDDVYGLKKLFYKSKVLIKSLQTNSTIKYNTSNASTKDGKRSACLVFDEIHEYENFGLINVFTSAFGKKEHSRQFYITTNGYVRDGVLDKMLAIADEALAGEADELGVLPMIYSIDHKKEVEDKDCWIKANPSLPHLPTLQKEMEKEYAWMKKIPSKATEFFTKRMNLPAVDAYTAVATKEQVDATNRPIPLEYLEGCECVGAVDYASVYDFASVGLLFKKDNIYYWLEHSFVCEKTLEPGRTEIKFPVREMARAGHLTIVKDDSIKADYIADWFLAMAEKYNIVDIRADRYRISLLRSAFEETGLPLTKVAVGARTHNEVAPIIDTIFAQHQIIWGDNPVMRWYTYNVYQDRDKKGNIEYKKIEPVARKTDGFFALIHALTGEAQIEDMGKHMDADMTPLFF